MYVHKPILNIAIILQTRAALPEPTSHRLRSIASDFFLFSKLAFITCLYCFVFITNLKACV